MSFRVYITKNKPSEHMTILLSNGVELDGMPLAEGRDVCFRLDTGAARGIVNIDWSQVVAWHDGIKAPPI